MTWKRAIADGIHKCGSCRSAIKAGELVAVTRTGLERCEDCGRKIEEPPAVVEEHDASGVPAGVRHQASLGFESAGEFARRFRGVR